jgi:hypothetical protein
MKRFLSLILLLAALSVPSQATTNFGVWQPKGIGPANPGSNHLGNPSVIPRATGCIVIASPCFGMWAGVDQANPNPGVYYFESADGLTSWTAYGSNPLSTLTAGLNLFPTVFNQSGTFYFFGSSAGGAGIFEFTSADGITWTAANGGVAIITPGSGGAWDQTGVFQLNICDVIAGTWFAYYAGFNTSGGNNKFQQGLVTSVGGVSGWTKSGSNPLIDGFNSTSIGATTFYKVGSTYYAYASGQYNNAQTNTNQFEPLFRWSSSSASGPWTQLTNGTAPISTYYPTIFDFAVTSIGGGNNQLTTQVGDPRFIQANGNLYLYYTLSNQFGSEIQVSEAFIPGETLAQLVATNEGVLNVPHSGTPFMDLTSLASDNFNGANANPIGGNWTTMATTGNFGPVQRLSNQLFNSSNSTPEGTAYWNPVTWQPDQFSQVTVSISLGLDVGAATRQSTTGAATCYNYFWFGTLGSSGQIFIQKVVAGTSTTLQNASGLTLVAGDTIMGVDIGSSHYYYWDGILIGAISDSSITSGAAGVMFFTTTVANEALNAWQGGIPISVSAGIGGKTGAGGKTGIGQ